QILRTFDLPGAHHPQRARLSRQKLDAIEKLETKPVDRLFKGVPVRGLATTLWIRPDPFICEGEIYLLGTVLSHFFALYASINSYHCLKIINTESQESWEWQEKMGQHALI
ncbi:type VI secretion system baseplate subunit TssF, partial [Escherichia coli]